MRLTPTEKKIIANRFNRVYQTLKQPDFLHQEMGKRLLQHLDGLKIAPHKILNLGSGPAFFSQRLEQLFPNAILYNLDLALGSFTHQKTPLSVCGDAECLPFMDQSIDFVFSNAMLHWSLYPFDVLSEIKRILKPEGLLLFSSFGPDTLKELRESFFEIDNTSPHVNHFIDMHDLGDMLLQLNFVDPLIDRDILTLSYEDLNTLIQDIRSTGNNYVFRKDAKDKKTITLAQLSKKYSKIDGFLPVTIEISYGIAWNSKEIRTNNVQNNIAFKIHPSNEMA